MAAISPNEVLALSRSLDHAATHVRKRCHPALVAHIDMLEREFQSQIEALYADVLSSPDENDLHLSMEELSRHIACQFCNVLQGSQQLVDSN